jgi:hypothetical protein
VDGLYAEVHRVVEEGRRLRRGADGLRETAKCLWEAKYRLVDAMETIKLLLDQPGHRLTATEKVIRIIIREIDRELAA